MLNRNNHTYSEPLLPRAPLRLKSKYNLSPKQPNLGGEMNSISNDTIDNKKENIQDNSKNTTNLQQDNEYNEKKSKELYKKDMQIKKLVRPVWFVKSNKELFNEFNSILDLHKVEEKNHLKHLGEIKNKDSSRIDNKLTKYHIPRRNLKKERNKQEESYNIFLNNLHTLRRIRYITDRDLKQDAKIFDKRNKVYWLHRDHIVSKKSN